MRSTVAFVFLPLLTLVALSQAQHHIEGTVNDSITGEPLVGAQVVVRTLVGFSYTDIGSAVTGENGTYQLTVPSEYADDSDRRYLVYFEAETHLPDYVVPVEIGTEPVTVDISLMPDATKLNHSQKTSAVSHSPHVFRNGPDALETRSDQKGMLHIYSLNGRLVRTAEIRVGVNRIPLTSPDACIAEFSGPAGKTVHLIGR